MVQSLAHQLIADDFSIRFLFSSAKHESRFRLENARYSNHVSRNNVNSLSSIPYFFRHFLPPYDLYDFHSWLSSQRRQEGRGRRCDPRDRTDRRDQVAQKAARAEIARFGRRANQARRGRVGGESSGRRCQGPGICISHSHHTQTMVV